MRSPIPPELARLLNAGDSVSRDQAWGGFVRKYSRILFHAAKSTTDGYDDAMDRYSSVLDRLRECDFRRLRRYASDGRTQFSTWLVLVARRMCIDYHRARYGRRSPDAGDGPPSDATATRRQLVDLVGARIDIEAIADGARPSPELALRAEELSQALVNALSDLPARDRILLKLRFEDDASAREIATMMGFPSPFHVYRRLTAVLDQLRRHLESHGVSDPTP